MEKKKIKEGTLAKCLHRNFQSILPFYHKFQLAIFTNQNIFLKNSTLGKKSRIPTWFTEQMKTKLEGKNIFTGTVL